MCGCAGHQNRGATCTCSCDRCPGVPATAEYEKAKQTPPKTGASAKITLTGVVKGHHEGGLCVEVQTDNADGRSACYEITDDRAVEILGPPRPDFKNGDVVRSTAYPRNIAVRHNSRWRWTDELDSLGWDDNITADHLDSGYKTAIRVGGEAA